MPSKATSKAKKATKVQKITPDSLMKAINKEFGAGTMVMASDPALRITRIPTGILAMDWLLAGGVARNRYIEIFGSADVGKTYFALCLIANAQANGLNCAWIECENKWSPAFAKACGVKLKRLGYHEQRSGNQVVDFMETLLYSEQYDVIVLDSIASLLPEAERDSDMSAGSYGTEQARLMSKALRKLTTANKKTAVVMLNQQREAIGVMFGKKTREPGGRAIKHYAGTRIEMVRTENIKRAGTKVSVENDKDVAANLVVGHRIVARIQKDQTGAGSSGEETTFVFSYTKQCHDPLEDLMYLGRVCGFIGINPSGKWWIHDVDESMCASRKAFKKWIRKNRIYREELEERIVEAIINKRSQIAEEDDE